MIPKQLKPRIVELGRIKIGGLGAEKKSRAGSTYRQPEKFDYFLITGNDRDVDGRLVVDAAAMEELAAAGLASPDGKIRQLPIVLLSDDLEDVISAQWARYEGKRRLESCDGETRRIYAPGGAVTERPCDGADHLAQGWKLNAIFRCVLAAGSARFGGFYSFRTTSMISTEQLLGGLLHIQQITGGVLAGIPLQLVVRPLQVAPDGKLTTVYVVHIEIRASTVADVQRQALEVARHQSAYAAQIAEARGAYRAALALPAGPDEPEDEQAAVATEYYPETIERFAPATDPDAVDPERNRAAVRTLTERGHSLDDVRGLTGDRGPLDWTIADLAALRQWLVAGAPTANDGGTA